MRNLHDFFMSKNGAYAKWHGNSNYLIAHWAILLAVVFLSGFSLFGTISRTPIGMAAATESSLPIGISKSHSPQISEDHILVKFKSNVGQAKRQEVMARHKLSEKSEIPQIGVKLMKISEDDTPEEVVDRLNSKDKDSIEFAEPDYLIEPSAIPNDPYYSYQWHLPKIGAPAAWDNTVGTSSVIVAILDTGVDCTHPDLAAHCVPGWNFYDNNSDTTDVYGHGTAVAGTVAAVGNNALGVASLSWNSSIMPVRISDATGWATFSTIANGLTYAADHGARVANNSYASWQSSSVLSAAQYFQSKGGVTTISAGNESTVYASTPLSPYALVMSATDSNDAMASWSNTGTLIALASPGVSIYLPTRGGGYGSWSGTSFSAPIVAGVAALMISVNPSLSAKNVQTLMEQNADDLGPVGWDPQYGYGRVNAARAVAAAASFVNPPTDTIPPTIPTNLTGRAGDATHIYLSWYPSTDNVDVTGYKVYRNGSLVATVSSTNYTDSSVVGTTTYTYTVAAVDAAGNISGQSGIVSITTPLPSVQITSHSVSSKTATTAVITWTTNIPSTGTVSYGLKNAMTLSATDSTSGTSHTVTVTGLRSGTAYYYKITALGSTTSIVSPIYNFRTNRK